MAENSEPENSMPVLLGRLSAVISASKLNNSVNINNAFEQGLKRSQNDKEFANCVYQLGDEKIKALRSDAHSTLEMQKILVTMEKKHSIFSFDNPRAAHVIGILLEGDQSGE